jgi:hypothetical protein
VNAGESSDDNLPALRAARYVPTDAWVEAFDAQCTEATLKRLRRYALLLARLPGGDHLGDSAAYAEEIVQAVVTDAMDGVLRWDPDARDLEPYLIDVIRLRIRRDRRRAARYEHVSLDAAQAHDPASLLRDVETGPSGDAPQRDAGVWGEMTATMERLRALVAADPLALRFLDALDQSAETRTEIMRVAGLTRAEYHNTRRRLARLLAHLHPGRRMVAEDN